jgi:hypothetical protein
MGSEGEQEDWETNQLKREVQIKINSKPWRRSPLRMTTIPIKNRRNNKHY